VTTIYKVRAQRDLHPSDPLHVGNFYPDKQRLHRSKMQDRQDLILYLAQLHATAIQHCAVSHKPRAFCEVPLRLMSLRDWVHDYRVVLDHFFEVKTTGFNFGDGGHEISILIPKNAEPLVPINSNPETHKRELVYVVPPRPDDGVISKVYIQQQNASYIRSRLAEENRADLRPAVDWLLSQTELNFIFQRSGRLKQRDTSVWPVAAIETWPSWLREALFGGGVDIENAYTQFLITHLRKTVDREKLELLFPDLLAAVDDKVKWRFSLCDALGVSCDDEGVSTVKKICMSLANGSRISPGILAGGRAFSVTAEVVIKATDDVSLENLDRIGLRLQKISRQYTLAKKMVCNQLLRLNPTRTNQKLVFSSYFEWEREARYAIWNAVDQHGIMVHDGIDGIPSAYTIDIQKIIDTVGLKVTT
jgi:hypothetical protein